MAEFTLLIDGMHCGSCIRRVTQALNSVEGVEVKEVRLGAARLSTAPGKDPIKAAVEALAKVGYNARLEQ
jgi:copper chaperone CopZ